MPSDCFFCVIAAGEAQADILYRDDHVLAFRDISPQAPLHALVIPLEHHVDVACLAAASPDALAALVAAAARVATEAGHPAYRLVFNTGADAGQSVFHVHGHVLAGRDLAWPPG